MNLKFVWWVLWSNMITIISTVQAIIAALMLYQDVFPHDVFRKIVIANAVLTAIIAQIKRNNPPGPSPKTKDIDGLPETR